jgi:hypothetical protein
MWAFFRRQALYFFVGFVVAFVIYLFIRFDADDVLLGIGIAAVAGIAVSAFLGWLETRFDESPPPQA